jgi:hypothetical protein
MTILTISKNKTYLKGLSLSCGCCGDRFTTWEGYEDQDQDNGYGICKGCQRDANKREKETMDRAIELVINSFQKAKNRVKFAKMDRKMQEYIVMELIDNGTLTWKIGK